MLVPRNSDAELQILKEELNKSTYTQQRESVNGWIFFCVKLITIFVIKVILFLFAESFIENKKILLFQISKLCYLFVAHIFFHLLEMRLNYPLLIAYNVFDTVVVIYALINVEVDFNFLFYFSFLVINVLVQLLISILSLHNLLPNLLSMALLSLGFGFYFVYFEIIQSETSLSSSYLAAPFLCISLFIWAILCLNGKNFPSRSIWTLTFRISKDCLGFLKESLEVINNEFFPTLNV